MVGVLAAWATVRASDDLDEVPLRVASADVVDGAISLFEHPSGLGPVETDFELYPTPSKPRSPIRP